MVGKKSTNFIELWLERNLTKVSEFFLSNSDRSDSSQFKAFYWCYLVVLQFKIFVEAGM